MNNSGFVLIAIFFCILVFGSCNKKNDEAGIKVAILAQGETFEDQSFLQDCKEGMERASVDFNLLTEYSIDDSSDKYDQRIENYASQDFDLIIVIGFMWNDALQEVAQNYPNKKFILVDDELGEARDNVVSIVFDVDEVAFPIGFISAWWAEHMGTDSPKTSCIGALMIPQIRQFIEPYNKGVVYYNTSYSRSVDTSVVYADGFFNRELGAFLSDSLINSGADIVFGVGSETAIGAMLEAKDHNIWVVGTDTDQYYSVPEVSDYIMTTAEKSLGNTIYDVVKSVNNNSFAGGTTYHGKLENNGVAIAPFHNADQLIADSIKIELDAIKTGIIDGHINTGW